MAKRGDSGEKRELPAGVAESVKVRLEKALEDRRWTHRDMEREWEIDKATISKVRNYDGGIGVGFLIKLREHLQVPIDEILGLKPLAAAPAVGLPPAVAQQFQDMIDQAVAKATKARPPPEPPSSPPKRPRRRRRPSSASGA